MALCKQCGVDILDKRTCPLCGTLHLPDPEKPQKPAKEEPQRLYPKVESRKPFIEKKIKRKTQSWEVFTVLFILASALIFVSDFLYGADRQGNEFNYAPYVLTILVYAWVQLTIFFFLLKHPLTANIFTFLALASFLAVLDLLDGALEWLFPLGLPILISFIVIYSLVSMIIMKSKRKGVNLIAAAALFLAFFCIALESIINIYIHQFWFISWSIVTALVLIPLAILLFYLHYRIFVNTDFKRYFHI